MTPVSFQLKKPAPKPPAVETDWKEDFPTWVARLIGLIEATVQGGTIPGQSQGDPPTKNVGLWLDGSTWKNWSEPDQQYLPLPVVGGRFHLGDDIARISQLIGKAQSGDISLVLPVQDKATLATLDDVNELTGGLDVTVSLSGTSFDLKCGTRYLLQPTGNFTITSCDGSDGMDVDLYVVTPPSASVAFTVTWPKGWYIGSGALPTTIAAQTKHTHIRISQVGSTKMVEFKGTFIFGSGGRTQDATLPTITDNNVVAGTSELLIFASEILKGKTIPSGDFTVLRDGVSNPVLFAETRGSLVRVVVAFAYNSGNTGSIVYAGTDITDVAGNVMAGFTLSDINIVSSSAYTVLRGNSGSGTILPPPVIGPPP